jgi:hypothetical protein
MRKKVEGKDKKTYHFGKKSNLKKQISCLWATGKTPNLESFNKVVAQDFEP